LIHQDRTKYRDMIDGRKEKENALLELIRKDKADPNEVKAAIEAAEQMQVRAKYIKKGKKFLDFMEYIKDFESQLQAAVAEKNKESLTLLLDRVEQEGTQMGNPLPLDGKILNDAKGNLAKMK